MTSHVVDGAVVEVLAIELVLNGASAEEGSRTRLIDVELGSGGRGVEVSLQLQEVMR